MYAISIQAGRNPPKQAGSEITNILCLPERMPDGSTKFKLGDHGDRFFSTISEYVSPSISCRVTFFAAIFLH